MLAYFLSAGLYNDSDENALNENLNEMVEGNVASEMAERLQFEFEEDIDESEEEDEEEGEDDDEEQYLLGEEDEDEDKDNNKDGREAVVRDIIDTFFNPKQAKYYCCVYANTCANESQNACLDRNKLKSAHVKWEIYVCGVRLAIERWNTQQLVKLIGSGGSSEQEVCLSWPS
eukprot:Nk52_evm22s317 gene=Nk52_evmTU22s317